MDGKDATVTIPMQFDKAVRNLADQTLVIEIEASAVENVEVSALLDISSLGGSAIFNSERGSSSHSTRIHGCSSSCPLC